MTDDPRGARPVDGGQAPDGQPPRGGRRRAPPEIEPAPALPAADEAAIERRLRRLGSVCAVLAAAVLVSVGAIGWLAGRGGGTDWLASPPFASFLIAFGAMLLVLLSSAVHGRILRLPDLRQEEAAAAEGQEKAEGRVEDVDRGAAERHSGEEDPPALTAESRLRGGWQDERRSRLAWSAGRLRAYTWATALGFAMLGVAAALGAMVAIAGQAPFYGLVICLASLLSMAARWPRRGAFEVALEAEHRPPPPPAGDRGAA
jgi:hypothetical protein